MPSQPPPDIGGKRYPIQWVHIDDFSPGCFDAGNISTEAPVNSQPLGSALLAETYCCSVIAGGALGPLPALVSSEAFSALGGLPGTATTALITGLVVTPQLDNAGYEIVVGYEADDGTNHYIAWFSQQGASLNGISGPTNTAATQAGFFGSPYPVFTRANAAGTPGPPPPGPVLIFPTVLDNDARGPDGHLWLYPELAAPTTFVAQDLITGTSAGHNNSSITGQVVTYGNRIICLVGVDYQWPSGGGINVNENFNYTDPPESAIYGNQQTIFAVEIPWGYGAWGTMSVGELLIVKKYGGGIIINGDINVPTSIIEIPGIQSTGDLVGQSCSTPVGLIYCSQNQGAWLWNGGNTSQKISKNISDEFFDLETVNNIPSNNYGFNVRQWQKWVMFSNNVLWDTDTGSWWNLFPKKGINVSGLPNGRDIWWYSLTRHGNQMITGPLEITSNTDAWESTFDNTVPSPVYQWQSLPIHVDKDADRVLDVRQIIVRASDPTNSGAATVTLTCGSFSATSTSTIGIDPTPLRFNVGDISDFDIILTLLAKNTASHAAPTIHSIDIGYIIRAGKAVED